MGAAGDLATARRLATLARAACRVGSGPPVVSVGTCSASAFALFGVHLSTLCLCIHEHARGADPAGSCDAATHSPWTGSLT
jgi:hypothetical protein